MVYNSDGFLSVLNTLTDELRVVQSGPLALQERDGANNITREYAWGPGIGGIGGLLNMRQSGPASIFIVDSGGGTATCGFIKTPKRYRAFISL
jgi:hypothetical protein